MYVCVMQICWLPMMCMCVTRSHDVLPLAVLELNGAALVPARFEDVLEGMFRAQDLAPVRDLQLMMVVLMSMVTLVGLLLLMMMMLLMMSE